MHRGVLAIAQARVVLPRAYTIDNHKLLLLYWTIALGLTTSMEEALRSNARRLIGLCFLLAVLWKVGWGEYFDGTFFRYTMARDPRFEFLAHWLGGAPLGITSINGLHIAEVLRGDTASAVLLEGPRSWFVALILSWWTLLTEAGIAAVFLAPARWRLARARNVLLLLFVLSTYAVAPVIGFAWLLILMGFAQTESTEPFARIAYLAALTITQVFLAPWGAILS